MRKFKSKSGLTTIELLLTVFILAIVMTASTVSLSSFLVNSQLDNKTDDLVQDLRTAQANSVMRVKDSQWGVYLDAEGDSFTFFKGSSYASRDQNYDLVTELPGLIDLMDVALNGGVSEVVFEKVTGETDNYGTLVVSEDVDNQYTITINAMGQIEMD